MITSIINHCSSKDAREINYYSNKISRNNRVSVTLEVDLYIDESTFRREKNDDARRTFRFIPERNDGIRDATCPKAMINRGSMRLTFAVRSAPVPAFLFLFRNTRAPHRESRVRRICVHRRITPHANGIWAQSLAEAPFTRARMYVRWPRNIIAVIRWNWGSLALTRVLGASTCCPSRVSVTFYSVWPFPRLVFR